MVFIMKGDAMEFSGIVEAYYHVLMLIAMSVWCNNNCPREECNTSYYSLLVFKFINILLRWSLEQNRSESDSL